MVRRRHAQARVDQDGVDDAWITHDDDESGWLYVADLDHDGRPDRARRVSSYDDGFRSDVRIIDADRDGAIDTRTTLTWYEQGDAIDKTVDYLWGGELHLLEHSTLSRAEAYGLDLAGPGGPVTIDETNCDPLVVSELKDAYPIAIAKGRACLAGLSSDLAEDFERKAVERPITYFQCGQTRSPTECADAINADNPNPKSIMTIVINSNPPPGCSLIPVEETVFHEMAHYAFGPHQTANAQVDRLDQVYGCEDYCFRPDPSTESCAACFAESSEAAEQACPPQSGLHSCRSVRGAKCFDCAGQEVVFDGKSFCAHCGGAEVVMKFGQQCCGTAACGVGQCGVCDGVQFCSDLATNPLKCEMCDGQFKVLRADDHCCPPETPRWNPVRMQCEGDCPGGAQAGGDDDGGTFHFELGKSSGSFAFNWETFVIRDRISVSYEGQTLFDSGCVGASGAELLDFAGSDTFVSVTVQPDCAGETGTAWDFSLACP